MTALIEKIAAQGGATRAEVRQDLAKAKPGRPKAYVFSYRPESKAFNLKLKFRKGNVPRQEVIEALEAILEELRAEPLTESVSGPEVSASRTGPAGPRQLGWSRQFRAAALSVHFAQQAPVLDGAEALALRRSRDRAKSRDARVSVVLEYLLPPRRMSAPHPAHTRANRGPALAVREPHFITGEL